MGGAPAAELLTMCSYLLQTSIEAGACSSWGCGLCLGGQKLHGPALVARPSYLSACSELESGKSLISSFRE
jgi:hypothetical protein